MDRTDLIRERMEQLKQKGEEHVMGGGKRAYLKDTDWNLLRTIVEEQFKHGGYSDAAVMKKVNEGDLLKLDGAEISEQHVTKARKELGLKLTGKSSKAVASSVSRRSKKTREVEEAPTKRGPKLKKDHMPGDNHPITIADLISALDEVKEKVEQFAEQERQRFEV